VGLQMGPERAAEGEGPLHGGAQQSGWEGAPRQQPSEVPFGDQHAGGRGLLPALESRAERDRQLGGMAGPGRAQSERDELIGRSEEHTSELQSCFDIVCRLLLEKKKKK